MYEGDLSLVETNATLASELLTILGFREDTVIYHTDVFPLSVSKTMAFGRLRGNC